MAADQGGGIVPGWTYGLRPLVPVAGTLVTVATNPVQFFRGPFLELAVEYVILRPLGWVLGYVLAAFETVSDVIGQTGGILVDPVYQLRDALVGAVNGVYNLAYVSTAGTGFAQPIALTVTTVVVGVVVLSILYGIARVIPGSDALEVVNRWT